MQKFLVFVAILSVAHADFYSLESLNDRTICLTDSCTDITNVDNATFQFIQEIKVLVRSLAKPLNKTLNEIGKNLENITSLSDDTAKVIVGLANEVRAATKYMLQFNYSGPDVYLNIRYAMSGMSRKGLECVFHWNKPDQSDSYSPIYDDYEEILKQILMNLNAEFLESSMMSTQLGSLATLLDSAMKTCSEEPSPDDCLSEWIADFYEKANCPFTALSRTLIASVNSAYERTLWSVFKGLFVLVEPWF